MATLEGTPQNEYPEDSTTNLRSYKIGAPRTSRIRPATVLYWMTVMGGLASIFGFLCSLPTFGEWRLAFSSTAFILALIGVQFYIFRENIRLREELDLAQIGYGCKSGYEGLHAIAHSFRDRFSNRFPSSQELTSFNLEDKAFFISVVDSFCRIMEGLTGVRCATCIKAYIPDTNILITIARDSISMAERSLNDQRREASIDENTASMRIIGGEVRYFFCNDLVSLADNDEYKCTRYDWQKWYRSTIVWPIRRFVGTDGRSDIRGLLFADSNSVNSFDRIACVQAGSAVADMIYVYLSHIDTNSIRDFFRQAQ